MLRVALAAGGLTIVLALGAYSAEAPQKLYIDCNKEELSHAVPELAGIAFDASQDGVDRLLETTGENLENMLAKFVDISAAEDIHEMRFEDGMAESSRREAFRYVVKAVPDGALEQLVETRIDPATKTIFQSPAHIDFLVTGRFLESLSYFLPEDQGQSRFRYIGRANTDEIDCLVVAFAEPPERLQGIAWIDAATKRMVRLRIDVRPAGGPLENVSTSISIVPVKFGSMGTVLWLPARVTVNARYAGGELHTVHRYSDYQAGSGKGAGIPAMAAADGEDAYELLTRGISLGREGKSSEEIAALREAVRLNPAIPAARFHLANALRTTGDLAGAESELREALKLVPDSGVIHNLLGVVLSQRGDLPGAVAEFRKSAQLQPKEASVHFNLAQVLERSGDPAAALEEYRTATQLAPDNAAFRARFEQLAHAAPEATIKVDVRQVLVPVIVTDRDNHHVTGLKRADFQVFEDGVEQRLSAFSEEDADAPTSAAPPPVSAPNASATPPPSQPREPVRVRQTYLICLDTLHAAFGNLVQVRQALSKLFQSEHAGDSQFAVLALGTSVQALQETTADPEAVLRSIDSKSFQNLYHASQKSSGQAEMADFRRTLDEVRVACDTGQRECSRKTQLPAMANQIASEERVYTLSFLSQFQSVVKEFSHAPGRRTIIFISDGFQLVPGKEVFELLVAYFPEFQFAAVRTVDRMQELDPILHLAANSNIPIYTIDSRGLYTPPMFDASNSGGSQRMMPEVSRIMDGGASEAGGTLSEIAAATGGTAFRNSNDILIGLQRAFADGRAYYMLAYVPGNSNADGKFHAISVRLRDKKLLVKAKRGYWALAN
jgi:VWFA-related protein